MATPASLPDTPAVQPSPQFLSAAFGGTLAMSAGLNKMVTDIANIWAKVGVGAANQVASAVAAGTVILTKLDGTTELLVPHWYNSLRNGGMERWALGGSVAVAASTSTTAGYGPDGWCLKTGATQASVVSQQAGLTDGSQWSAKVLRNSGQTGTGTMIYEHAYTLEEICKFRNQKCALTIGAIKAGANWSPTSGNISIKVTCGTGAAARVGAGAYTSSSTPITQTAALSTTAAALQYVSTVVVPTSTTQMSLSLEWTPVGTASTDDSFTVDDVMLVPGDVPMAFKTRVDDAFECLRHYEKTSALIGFIGSDNNTSKNIGVPVRYQVAKRINPTLTLYDSQGTLNKISTLSNGLSVTDNVTPSTGSFGGNVDGTVIYHAGTIAGIEFGYIADARL